MEKTTGGAPDMSNAEERQLQARSSNQRVFALDALRGLASLIVVFHHLRHLFTDSLTVWWQTPFFAGRQAVVLFFVLSGYVLSLSYWRKRALPYGRYLVRRVFRIWSPYVAALALAAVFAWKLNGAVLPLSSWFYLTWHTPVTPRLILQGLAMSSSPALNTAFWSLRYEMIMSIVFPPLCWLLLKLRPSGSVLLGLALGAISYVAPIATVQWSSCFILGAAVAGGRTEWNVRVAAMSSAQRWMLGLASLLAFYYGNILIMTLGSCGLLLACQSPRVAGWLDRPVPEYLGRISYSLYLTHGTVIFATFILLFGKLGNGWLVGLCLVLSVVVAHLFCVLVEEPSTKLGRQLTGAAATP